MISTFWAPGYAPSSPSPPLIESGPVSSSFWQLSIEVFTSLAFMNPPSVGCLCTTAERGTEDFVPYGARGRCWGQAQAGTKDTFSLTTLTGLLWSWQKQGSWSFCVKMMEDLQTILLGNCEIGWNSINLVPIQYTCLTCTSSSKRVRRDFKAQTSCLLMISKCARRVEKLKDNPGEVETLSIQNLSAGDVWEIVVLQNATTVKVISMLTSRTPVHQ